MDYVRYERLRDQYNANLANNYSSVGPSYGGWLSSEEELGETSDVQHHHNNNTNNNNITNNNITNNNSDYWKAAFSKRQKINIVEDQFNNQGFKAEDHQIIYSNASSYNNFSGGFDYSAARDTNLLNCTKHQEKEEHVMVKPIQEVRPLRAVPGILKITDTYINQEDSVINAQRLNKKPNLQNCSANKVDHETNNNVEEASLYNLERIDRHAFLKDILGCKLAKGDLVSPHVEKMIGLFEKLEKLGSGINPEVAIDIILTSLPDEYDPYIPTFLSRDFENTMYKLHEMLKTAEIHLKKRNHAHPLSLVPIKEFTKEQAETNRGVSVESNMGKMKVCSKSSSLMVQDKKAFKKKNNKSNNTKAVNQCKVKTVAPKGAKVDDKCHYCNVNGHWRRNCKKYLEDKKNGIVVVTQPTGNSGL